jgi:hypothetical protein
MYVQYARRRDGRDGGRMDNNGPKFRRGLRLGRRRDNFNNIENRGGDQHRGNEGGN